MTTTTTTQAPPQRDGRCFVETPPSVAEAARAYLAADAAWRNQPKSQWLDGRLYRAAQEARRELVRVMDEARGPHARLSGYYQVDGVWLGFDKVSAYGLTLVVKRSRPVFANQRNGVR